ncbi:hypothetical protein, partial [Roseobacter litoralis]|uniref:hypothetical protein n=1 Tax=Roseobacter litoralis TaxID=42443 RepID=UPI002490ED36
PRRPNRRHRPHHKPNEQTGRLIKWMVRAQKMRPKNLPVSRGRRLDKVCRAPLALKGFEFTSPFFRHDGKFEIKMCEIKSLHQQRCQT